MSTRRCLFIVCLLLLLSLSACGGGGSNKLDLGNADGNEAAASLSSDELSRQLGLQEADFKGLPPIPVDTADSAARGASGVVADGDLGSTRLVKGPEFFDAKRGLVEDGKLILQSDNGVGLEGVDWAMYRVGGMYTAMPETVNLSCTAATPGESYYIGIADYSSMSWKWFGPAKNTDGFFGFDLSENEDRLTSKNGSMYFLLMTPEGNSASHEHTTITPRTYDDHECNCRPGCPLNVIASNGDFDNGVQVSWDEADAADSYEIVRDEIHGGQDHSDSCSSGTHGSHTWGHKDEHRKDSDSKYCKDNDDHDRDNIHDDEDDDDDNDGKKDDHDDDDDNDGKKDDDDDDDDNDGLCDDDDDDHTIPDGCEPCINVRFECDKISVVSSKDISNVVLQFTDGVKQKFDGLSGLTGDFAGTGENLGKDILKAWVKSGCNQSGDGPGYGELFVPNYTYTNETVVGTTTDLHFFDSSAEAGVMYRYRVRAKNKKGYSKFCSSDCGWTTECDLTEDKCPTELSASDGADGAGVWVEWQAGGGSYDRFDVYRACTCFEVPVYEKIGETVNSAFFDETAECNKTYHYYVEKICGSKTCKSNVDEGFWLCEGYCPGELVATDCEGDAVHVTWNPGNGYGVFTVFRQEGDAIAILGITEDPEFLDDTAVCDLNYSYWVQKVVCGNPCDSNKDDGSRFCGDFCPSGLVASDDHEDGVELTWNPGDGSGSFEVLRKVKGGGSLSSIGTATGAVYVDTTAECEVRYVYQIRKTGACGDPCVTNEEEGEKQCCDYCPTELTATIDDDECVYLEWNGGCVLPPDGFFKIQRKKTGTSNWTDLGMTTELTYCDATAECNIDYTYRVKKWSSQGDCLSNQVPGKKVCCDYCPTELTATTDDDECVYLEWNGGCALPPDGFFKIQRKKTGTSNWTDLGMTTELTYCDATAECNI
ncbi:hypothetical protein IT575_14405, partial [bacterium]|nr:hypothetical protein [bacterium]